MVLAMGTAARAERGSDALVVTASNQATNQLLVYDTAGALVPSIPTGGRGGVSGNAGGIAVLGRTIAVVNFGSSSVSIFDRHRGQVIASRVSGGRPRTVRRDRRRYSPWE